ncbi:MAG: UDP-N-acetylmuramoyl-L-alanyl-D-glutamate--2,6-diaminopimelate ligase [Phycisphaerales bacterium]|nr:UDP-N-acetylmuramoyl-L-alanyl-D-glutamate--2,6-diaminopimelate ligase [Phycisphaerales bacterium]
MKLSHLIANVDGVSVLRSVDPTVLSVTDDSRQVAPATLFIARAGSKRNGLDFIADAVARGAVAVCVDASVDLNGVIAQCGRGGEGVAILLASDANRAALALAQSFHRFPTRAMRMIGITGTNGKTTTAFLTQHLINHSGVKCGLLGTVLTDDGLRREAAELTTPGGTELASIFARMVRNRCECAAMEVSSHALDQGRVEGIDFAVGVFTNLTGDHLDYHQTMQAYGAAKARLFRTLSAGSCAVVNGDDPAHEQMVRGSAARVLRCSARDESAACFVAIQRVTLGSMRLQLRGPWGDLEVDLPAIGRHNAMNALQATAAAWSVGVDARALASGLAGAIAPPGRLEPVTPPNAPFAVLVDYAHTDDALLNVLTAVRPVVTDGRLIVVFGCGGDRDRTKRPRMAHTAVSHADHVIITSDNPRTESAQAIITEIFSGIPAHCAATVERECDRATAIRTAIAMARPGDLVLIAGKGHEDYQIIGKQKFSFDDRIEARAALAALATRTIQGVST